MSSSNNNRTYPPLKIGPINLSQNVLLAPMSGVTDMPFRRLVKRHHVALVTSEMIASQAMIRATRKSIRMASVTREEYPVAVQLAGCDPEIMAEAAKLNVDIGAAIIDVNMGCPVKKVVNGYAGAALMRDEKKASRILESVVKAVNVPVTLKMRKGWDESNLNAPQLAYIAQECGIQMVTIHARTRCQLYQGKADWTFIRQVKDRVHIPVVGNGDILTCDDAAQMLSISGADGVMIGRGAYGKPWFLQQVAHFLKTGQRLSSPSIKNQKQLILDHITDILEHYGPLDGVKISRKHLGWYSKGLLGSTEFRSQVNQATNPEMLRTLIQNFYDPLIE